MQIRGKYKEMEDQRRQEESRQEKLSKALNDLRDAELELANLPTSEHPSNQLVGLLFPAAVPFVDYINPLLYNDLIP